MRTRYKDLSLQQIRTFREVCRQGSYTKVARRISLSPSAVWEQIHGLERYFEVRLLEYVDGSVQPTPDGRLLLELGGPLVAGLETIKQALYQSRGQLPVEMTVVSGMRMLMEEIATGIVLFRRKHPQVRIKALYAEDRSIDRLVEQGQADLAITLERGTLESPSRGVVHEPAYEYDYLLICPPKHGLLSRRPLRLKDILQYPLVLGTPGTRSRARVDGLLQHRGLAGRLQIAMETNSTALTYAAVRAGAGIGIAAAPLNGSLADGLAVRSLRHWFGKSRFVFVRRQGAVLSPVQRELERCVVACAQ